MRLIDADKLLKELSNVLVNRSIDNQFYVAVDTIKKQPTAYDVNKVVEELYENSVMRAKFAYSKAFYNLPQNGEYVDEVVTLSKAIEIVKRGGKNDD